MPDKLFTLNQQGNLLSKTIHSYSHSKLSKIYCAKPTKITLIGIACL